MINHRIGWLLRSCFTADLPLRNEYMHHLLCHISARLMWFICPSQRSVDARQLVYCHFFSSDRALVLTITISLTHNVFFVELYKGKIHKNHIASCIRAEYQ
mgnify:FL=1